MNAIHLKKMFKNLIKCVIEVVEKPCDGRQFVNFCCTFVSWHTNKQRARERERQAVLTQRGLQ